MNQPIDPPKNLLTRFGDWLSSKKPRFFFILTILIFCISWAFNLLQTLILTETLNLGLNSSLMPHIEDFLEDIRYLLRLIAVTSLFYGIALKLLKQINLSPPNVSKLEKDLRFKNFKGEDIENDLLFQYYEQSLEESRISFWFSIIMAAIGFFIIILSIFTPIYLNNLSTPPESSPSTTDNPTNSTESPASNSNSQDEGSNQSGRSNEGINTLAGIVISGVSALFFTQSNRSKQVLLNFAEKMRLDKWKQKGIDLTNNIENEDIQSKVKAIAIINLLGIEINNQDDLLAKWINSQKSETIPHEKQSKKDDLS